MKRIKILVAPLDWGLGHATRCIPVIKELVNQKCEVWIAAAGAQRTLLKEEFPFLPFVELPGYGIKYGNNRALTILRLLFSVPKILIRIKREKAWLKAFQAAEDPDAVISDNRYGLHAPGLFSVFITHQLRIRTPFGSFADSWLQRINYRAIRSFSRCWIPDVEGPLSLAGELSHPTRLPAITTRYIGWLSRLEAPEPTDRSPGPGLSSDLLVLLSGPEPQRTILEQKILQQAASLSGKITLVRGLPQGGKPIDPPKGMIIHDHLPAKALSAVINEADIVLSRAGYSTIMDLMKLGKKAIFIPTPGQTEQEYLGAWLATQRLALCVEQSAFTLTEAMAAARDFPFAHTSAERPSPQTEGSTTPQGSAISEGSVAPKQDDLLQKEIRSLLDQLRSRIQ